MRGAGYDGWSEILILDFLLTAYSLLSVELAAEQLFMLGQPQGSGGEEDEQVVDGDGEDEGKTHEWADGDGYGENGDDGDGGNRDQRHEWADYYGGGDGGGGDGDDGGDDYVGGGDDGGGDDGGDSGGDDGDDDGGGGDGGDDGDDGGGGGGDLTDEQSGWSYYLSPHQRTRHKEDHLTGVYQGDRPKDLGYHQYQSPLLHAVPQPSDRLGWMSHRPNYSSLQTALTGTSGDQEQRQEQPDDKQHRHGYHLGHSIHGAAQGRVLIILRGLPGSGKTTLAK